MPQRIISIPPRGKRAFLQLIEAGDEKRESLLQLLKNIKPSMDPEKVVDQIIDKIDFSREMLIDIISTIFSIYYNAWQLQIELSEFIENAVGSLAKGQETSKVNKVTQEQIKGLIIYLNKLALLDSTLGLSIKGIPLAMGNQKLFMSARVFSDIRPCFPSSLDKDFLGAIILHQLEINYSEDGEERKIYLTLDTNDIPKIQEQLLRAEEKERLLRKSKIFEQIVFLDGDGIVK